MQEINLWNQPYIKFTGRAKRKIKAHCRSIKFPLKDFANDAVLAKYPKSKAGDKMTHELYSQISAYIINSKDNITNWVSVAILDYAMLAGIIDKELHDWEVQYVRSK